MSTRDLDRREVINAIPSAAGLAALALSGCRSKADKTKPPPIITTRRPLNDSAPQTLRSSPFASKDSSKEECKDVEIDLANFDPVSENLETKLVFYGDSRSTLMVLSLPKYQHGSLANVIIMLLPSKRLAATRGIFEQSDILPDTRLRPLAFDNLRLKSDRRVAILYKLHCSECSGGYRYLKYEMPGELQYQTRFLGKDVYGATSSSLPPAFASNQAVVDFKLPERDSLQKRRGYLVPSLDTVLSASGLEGTYITDLAGNILATPNTTFSDFLSYPEFICYKDYKNQYFIRTFIRTY